MPTKYKTDYLQRVYNPTNHLASQGEETEEVSQVSQVDQVSNKELRRAIASPKNLSSGAVMTVQRAYGNQAALRMIQRSREEAAQTIQRVATPVQSYSEKEFQAFMTEKSRIPYFQEYCKVEFSEENFLAWHAVRHYKKNPSRMQAQAIYDQYISNDAPQQINLPSPTKLKVEAELNDPDFDGAAATIFDKLAKDLEVNLADTFTRFTVSEDYQKWKNAGLFQRGFDHFKGLKSKRQGHMDNYNKYKGEEIGI